MIVRVLCLLVKSVLRLCLYCVLFCLLVWGAGIALFAFLPVPLTAVMMEKQFSAWFDGNRAYHVHQQWVEFEDISPYMAVAVIAAEDQKFLRHRGFDVDAISAALNHNQRNANRLRGASTLSQQTAKNLFLWSGRSWVRKALEAPLTAGIEFSWSKRRILTVYLNVAEFGEGVFGVEAAAQRYFGKTAKTLTATEAARLAAVLPNPLVYNVTKPSNYIIQRQNWILRQMQQLGGKRLISSL